MPALQGVGNCQYTPLTTAGTTTLNPGPSAPPGGQNMPPPPQPGVLYGAEWIATGTNFALTVLDIIIGTATVTNTLMNGTLTAGQILTPGPQGIGVRYKGALMAVVTGTPGIINALWD